MDKYIIEFSKINDVNRSLMVHYLYMALCKIKLKQCQHQHTMMILHNYLDIVIKNIYNDKKENVIILMSSLLLLTCKLTENLRTIRDICSVCIKLIHNDYDINQINEYYIKIKMQVIEREQFILKVIGFNITFDVPYDNLFRMCKNLKLEDKYMKKSLSILNDCFLSRKSIDKSFDILAAGSLYISILIVSKMDNNNNNNNFNNEKWWSKYYNINEEELLETITWMTAIQKYFKPLLENSNVIGTNIEFKCE